MRTATTHGSSHFFFDIGNRNLLGFFDFPGHDHPDFHETIGGVQHIALSTSPENFRAAKEKLDAAGMDYLGPDRGVLNSLYLRDPNGIGIEFYEQDLGLFEGERLLARSSRPRRVGRMTPPDPPPSTSSTLIRTASNAGVWFARSIIGMRCEPSPAQVAHCAMPFSGSPGISTVTVSGLAPAATVLGGHEHRRDRRRVGRDVVARQHPACGVEVRRAGGLPR